MTAATRWTEYNTLTLTLSRSAGEGTRLRELLGSVIASYAFVRSRQRWSRYSTTARNISSSATRSST